jgi:hypothetical protein
MEKDVKMSNSYRNVTFLIMGNFIRISEVIYCLLYIFYTLDNWHKIVYNTIVKISVTDMDFICPGFSGTVLVVWVLNSLYQYATQFDLGRLMTRFSPANEGQICKMKSVTERILKMLLSHHHYY